jgi:hypothetical protein
MKKEDTVVMPKKKFIQEHIKLINLLQHPKKKYLAEEAKAQRIELLDVIKKRK